MIIILFISIFYLFCLFYMFCFFVKIWDLHYHIGIFLFFTYIDTYIHDTFFHDFDRPRLWVIHGWFVSFCCWLFFSRMVLGQAWIMVFNFLFIYLFLRFRFTDDGRTSNVSDQYTSIQDFSLFFRKAAQLYDPVGGKLERVTLVPVRCRFCYSLHFPNSLDKIFAGLEITNFLSPK